MGKFIIKIVFVGLIIGLLVNCQEAVSSFNVLLGNAAFSRGDYREANSYYEQAKNSDNYTAWVDYNLANTHYALGGAEYSENLWLVAANESTSDDVKYSSLYNLGFLEYQRGSFVNSYSYFRDALQIKPNSIPAKINLEIAQKKIEAQNRAPIKKNETFPLRSQNDPQDKKILNLIKQHEEKRRKAFSVLSDSKQTNDW